MVNKEKEIAMRDQNMVKKMVRIDANNISSHLLDFVGDVFIQELLFNITKYMQFTERKEYCKHAY